MKIILSALFFSLSLFAQTDCLTVKQTDRLLLQKCDNLDVLWLKGTPVERARAHGSLLGKELTLDNLNLFVELSVRGMDKSSLKFKLADPGLNLLTRWAGSKAPQSYHDEVDAMAIAAGISAVKLKRAILLPDIGAFSWAALSKEGKNLPVQGCTSAVYTNEKGRFIQGRNLDFPGTPSYDNNPLLVIHKPAPDSGELQHVSIGTHGLQFSGIHGFNEAGISFAVHQNYTRLISIKGVPMPYIGELVLRTAKNLDEAVEIIKKNRPGPLWTFVISDFKTDEVLTVEVSNTHFKVRRKTDPTFSQSNFIVSDLFPELALMDAGTYHNSKFRFDKALETMKSWQNPKAENMANFLGWQKSRTLFSPISDVLKSHTIQSIVYERLTKNSPMKFYVTIDPSPAPTGRWAEFNIDSFWRKTAVHSTDIKIHDFIKLPLDQRKLQREWTEVYALDIMTNYPAVIQRLIPRASSADAYLALSALQLKTNQPKESLVSAQKGLSLATVETHPLIKQGLEWNQIASLWQMDKKNLVINYALALNNKGIIDPAIQKEVRKILKKDSPSKPSLHPGFDFFGGALQGMPSRP